MVPGGLGLVSLYIGASRPPSLASLWTLDLKGISMSLGSGACGLYSLVAPTGAWFPLCVRVA